MKSLRLRYTPTGWVIDTPQAPTPAQMVWLKAWLLQPRQIDHLLNAQGVDQMIRANALADAIAGKITANLIGREAKLFEAPRPDRKLISIPGIAV